MLLCLPPLLMRSPAMAFGIPVGPPGLSLHLALDPLSASFLLIVFLTGTAISAYQATAIPLAPAASVRMTASALAGTALVLLAADGVSMAIGLAVTCCAVSLPGRDPSRPARSDVRRHAVLFVPLLVLVAVCLLTPSGFAPRFDAIRAAPVYPGDAVATALLTIAAAAGLAYARPTEPCWTRDALTACALIPTGTYLLLRLIADLSGGTSQTECGFGLLLAGGVIAIMQGLVRRQASGHRRCGYPPGSAAGGPGDGWSRARPGRARGRSAGGGLAGACRNFSLRSRQQRRGGPDIAGGPRGRCECRNPTPVPPRRAGSCDAGHLRRPGRRPAGFVGDAARCGLRCSLAAV